MPSDPFKALADASRRHLLDQLKLRDGLTLAELCEELAMSRQAVSKHLAILEDAGLVVSVQRGRHKHHYLNPVPLVEVVDRWVAPYRRREAEALVTLKRKLESKHDKRNKQ